jgi:predicted cation transporter
MTKPDLNIVSARPTGFTMSRWRSVGLALGIAVTFVFAAYVFIAIWMGSNGVDIQFNSAGGR